MKLCPWCNEYKDCEFDYPYDPKYVDVTEQELVCVDCIESTSEKFWTEKWTNG